MTREDEASFSDSAAATSDSDSESDHTCDHKPGEVSRNRQWCQCSVASEKSVVRRLLSTFCEEAVDCGVVQLTTL